ncbi:MAG: LacI family DNA-binding transcriptional regulator [Anaerolineae bacterium]|nr:LacI family DNA-binding transcriptional regulator [Anaerolineae bacterium]
MLKSPTQADVANLACVSRSTVSFVLNNRHGRAITITDETRRKVLDAAQQLGYQPNAMARSLRSGLSHTIGVLIPNLYNLHYMELLAGIEEELTERGYHLALVVTNFDPERERSCFHALFQQRLDGLILMPTFWDMLPDEMAMLAERGSPAVFIPAEKASVDWVAPDIKMGAELLMDHLLNLGHRRIGFINGVVRSNLTQIRQVIYRKKLAARGIPFDGALFCDCAPTMQDGFDTAMKLLSLTDPPTAIWAINDLLAVGVQRAVQSSGLRIPDDVAVAGFDDTTIAAQLYPPLTSVRLPAHRLGQRAAKILLKRIQEPGGEPMREILPATLIIRQSTDPTVV